MLSLKHLSAGRDWHLSSIASEMFLAKGVRGSICVLAKTSMLVHPYTYILYVVLTAGCNNVFISQAGDLKFISHIKIPTLFSTPVMD